MESSRESEPQYPGAICGSLQILLLQSVNDLLMRLLVSEEGAGLPVSDKILALKSRMDKYTGKGFFHAFPENLPVIARRREQPCGMVDDVG